MPEPAQPVAEKGVGHAESDGEPTVVMPCPAASDVAPDGDRMRVSLRGELDLGGQLLQGDLHEALRRSGSGIDLDLTALRFCDCSGLNILLDLRRRALGQGKTVMIRGSSPAVERLLDETGTRDLLAHPGSAGKGAAPTARHDANPREETGQDLCTEVLQLRRAMQTRPTIDLARGMLMASFGLTPEAAWNVLVKTSQNTNTKLHRLARDLVGTMQGGTLPEAVQKQLTAAVADANRAPAPPTRSGAAFPHDSAS
ncbi:ANTAR domain-containing protein [Streptomyces sp. Rer75]|uniref:ANTAR domain-containing protein n=1 Tax=unclassified Streptomyces TaxID=2593676 RepID=UPI0015CFB29A|nr:ANTAR domain-containing protein [Streptomyces sp. Rer75]QLH24936.1 ANTAR domain-containing protein [Streptomyces sp. Rer75]